MSGYSTPAGPVLDYASPRPRGKVRLPSRSRLELLVDSHGATVREWLEAKAGAIVAMLFAVSMLIMLPTVAFEELYKPGHLQKDIVAFALIGIVWVSEATVLLMVINNTWRRTTLQAQSDALLLTFSAPFGRRRYEWPADQVEQARMEPTTTQANRNHLGELQIHIAGHPLVKLFTDHSAAELDAIAAAVRRALDLEAGKSGRIPPPLPQTIGDGGPHAIERAAE